MFGSEGVALGLLIRYELIPALSPSSLDKAIDRLDRFLGGALTMLGQQEIQQAQYQQAASQAELDFLNKRVITPLNAFINRHEKVKDAVAVGLDVSAVIAGVAAGAALLAGGATLLVGIGLALSVIGGLAAVAMLWQDVKHLWFVMRGDEAGKLALEADPRYQWIEAVGPLLALPDLAMSGRAALREMVEASAQAGRAGQITADLGRTATARATDFRQMMADPDQSAKLLTAARQSSDLRAAQYRRMQAMTSRINHDLMLKRNAVLAYGGTAYGTGMYALQPPALAQRLIGGSSSPQRQASQPQPPNSPFQMLATAPSRTGPSGSLQVTAVATTRKGGS